MKLAQSQIALVGCALINWCSGLQGVAFVWRNLEVFVNGDDIDIGGGFVPIQ